VPQIFTRTILADPKHPDPGAIAEAARVLMGGGLVAFPTETVYGLGAPADDPIAVRRIFEAKGRPQGHPLIVHADNVALARRCVEDWSDQAEALADRFWPGPLTLILPRSRLIPDVVTGGGPTVGVRIPASRIALDLIAATGRPIAAPSANRSTRISPTRAEHVFKDLDGRVDLILDGGPCSVGLESTVLDLSAARPRILRPGSISAADLATILGVRPEPASLDPSPGAIAPSPGLAAIHYAPRNRAIRVEFDEIARVDWPKRAVLIVIGDVAPGSIPAHVLRFNLGDVESTARGFYAALHAADDLEPDLIVVATPPDVPEWAAILDRVRRATTPG
jgi:L-threonylcarbamoyladenylate synthase